MGLEKEVMEAALRVLDASNVDFDYTFADAGDEQLEKTGVALPQETLDTVKSHRHVCLGLLVNQLQM